MRQALDILRAAPFRAEAGAHAAYDPGDNCAIQSLDHAFDPALQ